MQEINRFLLLGKIGPNSWVPIGKIYDEFNSECFEFVSEKQALQAKANLKNYLANYKPKSKVPLTIRKIRVPA
jgi:hypothetical protein